MEFGTSWAHVIAACSLEFMRERRKRAPRHRESPTRGHEVTSSLHHGELRPISLACPRLSESDAYASTLSLFLLASRHQWIIKHVVRAPKEYSKCTSWLHKSNMDREQTKSPAKKSTTGSGLDGA